MGVNKVDLSTGETLIDISNDTVTPETLAKGATAHNAAGERIVGEMKSSGGSDDPIDTKLAIVTCDLDLVSMNVYNFSHHYQEILELFEQGYAMKIKVDYGIGICFGEFAYFNRGQNELTFQVIVQSDALGPTYLMYFNVVVRSNAEFIIPYIINTTDVGG